MAENTQVNNNLYKKFRRTQEDVLNNIVGNSFTKRYDEPTYFSFRLMFGSDRDIRYNVANDQALYDTMPHPLFNPSGSTIIENFSSGTRVPFSGIPITTAQTYSAMQYLVNSNEPTRAEMMQEFIEKFNTLQYTFPYYFQSIEGLADLLKVDPTKGQRETSDKKVTITCLEGLDLRMSYLLNLYRKIAWDDIYQRWVLPDMMRYFTLNIYLAEFRTFHFPASRPFPGTALPDSEVGKNPLYLNILDNVLPTWVITCELCEFDLTDITFDHLSGLSVATDPTQGALKFSVKVGNIKEMQIYPTFKHSYLIDRKLNGRNRASEEISTRPENNTNLYPVSLQIAQNRESTVSDTFHVSGLPFNEGANSKSLYGERGPGPDGNWSTGDDDITSVDPTNPATWVGNAATFGKSYAKNFVNKFIDKGKITPIPQLGVSFSEVQAAIQGKNIIGALGLIRKGVDETVRSFGNAPSQKLDDPIRTDEIMKAFFIELSRMSKSQATDEDTKILGETAALALSDRGIWEQIRDFSLATDLTGPGEVNVVKSLEGTRQYQQIAEEQSKLGVSSIEPSDIPRVAPNAASGSINEDRIGRGTASSQLEGNISDEIDQPGASEKLSSSTEGDRLLRNESSERLGSSTEGASINQGQASEKIDGEVAGNITQTKPSSNLSSTISGEGMTDNEPNVKTRTIDVNKIIEYDPTSIMYKKIEGGNLSQPAPSKATNSKLE